MLLAFNFFNNSYLLFERTIGLEKMHQRDIRRLEVTVSEAPNQSAAYRAPIPSNDAELEAIARTPLNIKPEFCCEKSNDSS